MKATMQIAKFEPYPWLRGRCWAVTAWGGYSVGPCLGPRAICRIQSLPAVCSVNINSDFWREREDVHVARPLFVRLAKILYPAGAANVVYLVYQNWWNQWQGRDCVILETKRVRIQSINLKSQAHLVDPNQKRSINFPAKYSVLVHSGGAYLIHLKFWPRFAHFSPRLKLFSSSESENWQNFHPQLVKADKLRVPRFCFFCNFLLELWSSSR